MKLLLIHASSIEWEVQKRALAAAPDPAVPKDSATECLVAFCAVEKPDEKEYQKVAQQAVASILDVLRQIKTKSVVLYPYAHLSSDLSSPGTAQAVLDLMDKQLREKVAVKRAPFGYYKSFTLSAKGHPLAELSRSITPSGVAQSRKPAPQSKIILDRRSLPPNDHRILGEDLQLFHFSDDVGAGLPLWLPKGEVLRNQLIQFMRLKEEEYGYQYVTTPHIAKGQLYEKTGHLPYYKDSMYTPIQIDGVDYYLKPMNCPHHHQIYSRLVRSYRDLPLRLAEPGMTYRNELSGVTYGLIRVRGFTQNDSHIYTTPAQLRSEFLRVLQLFEDVYKTFGIKEYWFRLSLPDFKGHPEKFTGDPMEWEHACEEIRAAMKAAKIKFVEETGEAAFYGPKIDVQIKNTLGKEETIATSQVDIVVPRRLGLSYVDEKDQKQTPIVIHRAILGSYDRFVAYLLEQTAGQLPVWLSPIQVRVLAFTERNNKTAEKFCADLRESGIRAEADASSHTLEHKVRDAELQKIPYIVTIGDKEEKSKSVAIRRRGEKKIQFGVKKPAFLKEVQKAVETKK